MRLIGIILLYENRISDNIYEIERKITVTLTYDIEYTMNYNYTKTCF